MRNFFFMVFCMVALLLPESLWAQDPASVSGTKLTITTTAPGQVSDAVSGLSTEQKAAITEIVLDGKFGMYNYQNELELLGKNAGFTAVEKVDMSEAQFVSSVSGSTNNYSLFESTTSGTASFGTHAIVGGTLYVSANNQSRVWNACGTPNNESARVLSSTSDVQSTDDVGDYGKIQKETDGVKYLQLSIAQSWSDGLLSSTNGAVDLSNSEYTNTTVSGEEYIQSVLSNYSVGQRVWFYHYYKVVNSNWVSCSREDYANAGDGNQIDNDVTYWGTPADAGEGKVIRIVSVYTKQETREWTNQQNSTPDGYDINNDANYDYAYRDSHLGDYSTSENGKWVKMIDYDYYQLANGSSSWEWEQVNYSDGQNQYLNKRYANDSEKINDNSWPNNANQYALVGGTEYIYDGTAWKLLSEVTECPNYSLMMFSYWQETLTTAITSKYANETISGDIFQNCKKLTYVDYKAGNVTGFIDHKIASGYNTSDNTTLATGLSVTIGKNVTKISATAFKECDVLTSLEFDMDYESSNPDKLTGVTYPLNLDINENAFLQCYNLSGVVFPNRVRSIGNGAFMWAGTGNNVEEFTVEFERRKVDNGASIEYDVNLTLGADAFGYCKKLKTISLPIRLESMGNSVFENSGLEHFEIREDIEDSRLTVIPTNAFLASQLQEVVIPRSVTEIKGGAFMNCPSIRTVTFQESKQNPQPTLRIRSGAFSGGNEQDSQLTDVYVNIDPTKRLLICEYDAFSFTTMVGQTNENSGQIARLHFSEEYWDYYAGNWKKGLAFNQGNLNAIKEGYTDATNHPEYKEKYKGAVTNLIDDISNANRGKYVEGLNEGEQYTPANGWQQFARTSTGIDIDIHKDKGAMRTYSTKKPVIVPEYASDDNANGIKAGDPMFKIYRISNFDDGTKTSPVGTRTATGNEVVTTYEKSSVTYQYVPANSGFIMTTKKSSNGYLVYMVDADAEEATTTYPYNATIKGDGTDNLLYPTCLDVQYDGPTQYYTQCKVPTLVDNGASVMLYPTIPHPFNKKGKTAEKGKLQYRLFGLSSTAEGKFNRLLAETTITRDKAYLKLTPELFSLDNEGENASGSGVDAPSTSSAPIMLALMDPDGNTTDIRMIDPETLTEIDNSYYTLQGVKLNGRPTQKGIYIHYGKKVVIK